MQQAKDFRIESDFLAEAVLKLDGEALQKPTLFKNWSVEEVIIHLYFWNNAADMALKDPYGFSALYAQLKTNLKNGTLRAFENDYISERGHDLISVWKSHYSDMADRWFEIDPKQRVNWAGPDMSTRSSMSARQMETWAHGQAVFDALGYDRSESDRIQNIVILGVNAFGWSHKVHGLPIPEVMPNLVLTSPSGKTWTYGDAKAGSITGSAVEFCQVVTQTRNILDTELIVDGTIAQAWMKHAQCFAGPAEKPPRPGQRFSKNSNATGT